MKYPEDFLNKVTQGDCLEVLKTLPENSIDTIITDPPYNLSTIKRFKAKDSGEKWNVKSGVFHRTSKGFMGKEWDNEIAFQPGTWEAVYRVAKPGATLLCFGGTRTFHRLACAIEDAGWIIKDTIMWIHSQGFPKSLNIEKSLQKKYGYGNMEGYENRDEREIHSEKNTKYNLRLMSEADLSQTINPKKKQGEVLQSGLSQQSIPIKRKKCEGIQVSERRQKSSVEGRIDIQTDSRELSRCKVCALSERMVENGEERWVCNGTPFGYGTAHWQNAPADRSCPSYRPQSSEQQDRQSDVFSNKPSPQEIRKWKGYGTALKPAFEPIIFAVKPNEGSYCENALKWGVAGLNIDGGRIGTMDKYSYKKCGGSSFGIGKGKDGTREYPKEIHNQGRFPANILLECICDEIREGQIKGDKRGITFNKKASSIFGTKLKSTKAEIKNPEGKEDILIHTNPDCPCYMLDEMSGKSKSQKRREEVRKYKPTGNQIVNFGGGNKDSEYSDSGGASRFFYVAKASRSERTCNGQVENRHPTIKSLALMRYLVRLTKTPTGGVILDCFAGSCSTLMAAKLEKRPFIGIEKEEEYVRTGRARLDATPEPML